MLFLVYINDLHSCINHSTVRHFADDTNLLYATNKNKPRNRNVVRNLNKDLKSLNHWLLANKISLNSTKTELIIFRNKRTKITNLDIRLNGTKLNPLNEIKYVGITFDEHLTFSNHISLLNAKLKRANNLIAISRHYLSKELLLQIYYGQFYSHLTYGCQLWGQDPNRIKQTFTLQKKCIRLMTFSHYLAHTDPLFKELNILKLYDMITFHNIIFTHNTLNKKSPNIFNSYFKNKLTSHHHYTINNLNTQYCIPKGSLDIPNVNTTSGEKSIRNICSKEWNLILRELSIKYFNDYENCELWLQNLKINKLKFMLKQHFL